VTRTIVTTNNNKTTAPIDQKGLNKLTFLERDEIEIGSSLTATVTRGSHCTNLYAVTNIDLKSSSNLQQQSSTTDKQRARRVALQSSVKEGTVRSQSHRYTIKLLSHKTLHESDSETLTKAAKELINDAKFLARLNSSTSSGSSSTSGGGGGHPNIPRLYAMTLDSFGRNYLPNVWDDFFLIIDGIQPNDTLADRIHGVWSSRAVNGGEPDEDLIPMKCNIAFQLARALRYCHQHGVLYRDLKPPNVGFSNQDPHVVQLLDFGLARELDESDPNRCITLAGSRRYVAGEVLATGQYTFKSDVYSWAMTLYEMLAEKKPFAGLSATDHQRYVCDSVLKKDAPCGVSRPSLTDTYIPEQLEAILRKSWHADVSQRYSIDEVCNEMQAFLMAIDIDYYEQNEGEFLFDVHVSNSQEELEEIEDLQNDEDWQTMGKHHYSLQLLSGAADDEDTAIASSVDLHEVLDLRTSFKATESADTGGARGPVVIQNNRCKIIPSAA